MITLKLDGKTISFEAYRKHVEAQVEDGAGLIGQAVDNPDVYLACTAISDVIGNATVDVAESEESIIMAASGAATAVNVLLLDIASGKVEVINV